MKNIKTFKSFNESLSPLKSLKKELVETERKRESLIRHGKGLPSPSAFASKNKVELKRVEKEIKDINSKIKKLEITK